MNMETQGGTPSPQPPRKGNQPVVVYIAVLFLAAFFLMALSFATHQRTAHEDLGDLQDAATAMQEVQATQDRILQLQKELNEALKTVEDLEDTVQEQQDTLEVLQSQIEGMNLLYTLQQQYAARNFAACQDIIAQFEDRGFADCLPQPASEEVTDPIVRYQQLKGAVEAHFAAVAE